ncbi:hypothetical protein H0H87_001782 [Tephrocybe sp. NHM501043]|nr:hypothetical protein H0H87_001782 [Tephrocybe sp. NHM501043]
MSTTKSLPTRKLGKDGPTVSALGLGAMGLGAAFYGNVDEKETFDMLSYAADRGMTFWDTADIYGGSEKALGRWFAQTGRRSEIFLATKFGAIDLDTNDWTKPNSKPTYIKRRLENSLADLQTDYIDLYYQHRVDPEVPIEVVLETLRPFVEAGTIRWIGLSEPSVATLKRAKAVEGVGDKVIVAQMEYSPFELYIEKNGFVDAINEASMAVVAYSPLARGLVTGRFRSRNDFEKGDIRLSRPKFSEENFPKNLKVVDALQRIGEKHGATNSQITLAWILAEHPNFVPIPGSRNVQRLEENAQGAEISLTKEDVEEIRALVESAEVLGARYPSSITESTGDCIPLSEWVV